MSVAYAKKTLTETEYLEMERQAEERNEFYNGECYAMSGASRKHNRLAVKMVSHLEEHLSEKPCDVYMADMRLQIEEYHHYTYPDVMLVCGEAAFIADDMVNDATLIIEILSPSTEQYDRGKKFFHYQSLPSIQEYLLISQEEIQIELFTKQSSNKWTYQAWTHLGDVLSLHSIGFQCTLQSLYEGILDG